MLSGVIIGYKWAFRKMAEFESDIQHLLLASTGSEKSKTTDTWYRREFEDIFDWKKSVTASAVFTVLAFVIAFKMAVAAWFPTKLTQIVGFIPYMLIGTVFGACVWPGYRMSRFVHTLAKTGRQINPFVPWSVGIFNIARTFIKFEAVGILLFEKRFTGFKPGVGRPKGAANHAESRRRGGRLGPGVVRSVQIRRADP